MYIGEGFGWRDVSFNVTSVDPVWYGSDVLGGYTVIPNGQISTTELKEFTASGDYTVSEDGFYCIEVAAGSTGSGKDNITSGGLGGNTKLRVNNSLFLESLGKGGRQPSGCRDNINSGKVSFPIVRHTQIGFIEPSVFIKIETIPSRQTTAYLNDARELGIAPLVIEGSLFLGGPPYYYTVNIEASSMILSLKAGDILTFEIGAGGTKHSSGGINGNAGKARIHLVQGMPL